MIVLFLLSALASGANVCFIGTGCRRGTDRGLGGLILNKHNYGHWPQIGRPGGWFNSGWRWVHPRVCCSSTRVVPRHMEVFAPKCPPGFSDKGLGGIILHKSTYHNYRKSGHAGGMFNSGWRWLHPRICRANSRKALKYSGVSVLSNRGCPAGSHRVGTAGLILNKHSYGHYRSIGGAGGWFNSGWRWVHPQLCVFPKYVPPNVCFVGPKCAAGTHDKGLAGLILHKHSYGKYPTIGRPGGWFNSGWRWVHPRVCCEKRKSLVRGGMEVFAPACPAGFTDHGLGGIIMHNRGYGGVYNKIGAHGGLFNSGWRWVHPRVCRASRTRSLIHSGACVMANQACPAGSRQLTYGGIIMNKHTYGQYKQVGAFGGLFNSGWRWLHPRICCFPVRRSVCFIGRHCTGGTKYRALGGTILPRGGYARNAPQIGLNGGLFNSGWQWTHPKVCCAARTKRVVPKGLEVFAPKCPGGFKDLGYGGLILPKGTYNKYYRSIGAAGGNFNGGWRWVHPRICLASHFQRSLVGTGVCVMANGKCPAGSVYKGLGGMILARGTYGGSQYIGHVGGGFNSGWQWIHPRMCCFSKRNVAHPGGSYRRTCRSCFGPLNNFRCFCRTRKGTWMWDSINTHGCKNLHNINGRLMRDRSCKYRCLRHRYVKKCGRFVTRYRTCNKKVKYCAKKVVKYQTCKKYHKLCHTHVTVYRTCYKTVHRCVKYGFRFHKCSKKVKYCARYHFRCTKCKPNGQCQRGSCTKTTRCAAYATKAVKYPCKKHKVCLKYGPKRVAFKCNPYEKCTHTTVTLHPHNYKCKPYKVCAKHGYKTVKYSCKPFKACANYYRVKKLYWTTCRGGYVANADMRVATDAQVAEEQAWLATLAESELGDASSDAADLPDSTAESSS